MTVVAQVVLRPSSGLTITGDTVITAANLPNYLPDPDHARTVVAQLRREGFDVGPVVGIGMSITGPIELFERFFATSIRIDDDGSAFAVGGDGVAARELPLDALPDDICQLLHSVSFEPPAEAVPGI